MTVAVSDTRLPHPSAPKLVPVPNPGSQVAVGGRIDHCCSVTCPIPPEVIPRCRPNPHSQGSSTTSIRGCAATKRLTPAWFPPGHHKPSVTSSFSPSKWYSGWEDQLLSPRAGTEVACGDPTFAPGK